ncbi:25791_t:CDS:2 [Racocetra persica]|uniref:25791_t:CDS:1 n=1 Tax=Racocetra persica TaxID=160502 RepID=A0ACA9M871_9GLOM|nr:25791_t:CDS:2 [Racocetra persica]
MGVDIKQIEGDIVVVDYIQVNDKIKDAINKNSLEISYKKSNVLRKVSGVKVNSDELRCISKMKYKRV